MKKEGAWIDQLRQKLDLPSDIMPLQTQIVLGGNSEVTVYGHRGIGTYSHQQICIRIRSGYAVVSGEHLEIARMNPSRLMISGSIRSVELEEPA